MIPHGLRGKHKVAKHNAQSDDVFLLAHLPIALTFSDIESCEKLQRLWYLDSGMVSMLPTVVNDLFQIEGGNMQVPQKLLEYADVLLHRASTVTHITDLDGHYQIQAVHDGAPTVGV